MKRFLRYFALYWLFTIGSAFIQAQAAPQATLTITPSLTNTDGSTITSTLTCNVYQGPKGAEGATPVQTGIACNTTATVTITAGLLDGTTVCFQATEVEGGQESAKSVEGCKTFPPATPQAPSLTVQ